MTTVLPILLLVSPAGAASTNRWKVGVYRGSLRADFVALHDQWLGRRVETVLEMIPKDSWASIESPTARISAWKGTPYDVVFTTPMLPSDGSSTLAKCVAGAYDERWRTYARTMAAGGRGNAIVRLGHEFNHTWYPWTAAYGRELDFAGCYRRVVTVLRSVPGTSFRMVWNPLSGVGTADVAKAYPGDAYVDIISLDLYDGSRGITDFNQRWQKTLTQAYGLNWLKTFAGAHNKPMAFDEWGLIKSNNHATRDPKGDSGDDTVYINGMLDFFQTERVAYANYFDVNTKYGSTDSRIQDGPYPNASRTYRSRVGALPYSTSSSPIPAPTTTSTTQATTTTTIVKSVVTTTTVPSIEVSDDTVAVVVGSASQLPPKDEPLVDRLEDLDHDVVLVDDDTLSSPAALRGAPVVVISSSVVPSKIPAWFAQHEAPILDAEAWVQTTLGLATANREESGVTSLEVRDTEHPVSAGREGVIEVQASAPMATATPVAGATVIAGVQGASTASVYAIDEGDDLVSGEAPARRVGFFFSYDSPPAATADGWAMFDAAMAWLAEDAAPLPVPAPEPAPAPAPNDDAVDDEEPSDDERDRPQNNDRPVVRTPVDDSAIGGGEGRSDDKPSAPSDDSAADRPTGDSGADAGSDASPVAGRTQGAPTASRVAPGGAVAGNRIITMRGDAPVTISSGAPEGARVVAGAATPSGNGTWSVLHDGAVYTTGDARYFGSTAGQPINAPITAMAPTPTGNGYWLLGADGGVFTFGDAEFHGSTGNLPLNKPIVGIAATATGSGYWLFAGDGGVFTFGDAAFHGSTGGLQLNTPITAMAATPAGGGYWLLGADGGVFTFGDAPYVGSTGAYPAFGTIEAIVPTTTGAGYWLVGHDGKVHAFGDAR